MFKRGDIVCHRQGDVCYKVVLSDSEYTAVTSPYRTSLFCTDELKLWIPPIKIGGKVWLDEEELPSKVLGFHQEYVWITNPDKEPYCPQGRVVRRTNVRTVK